MICVAITAKTSQTALSEIERALVRADMVELRLDYIQGPIELKKMIAAAQGRAIATCRAADEGGLWQGSEQQRIELLLSAGDLGAAYIDLELAHLGSLPRRPKCKLILSHHDFDQIPANLGEVAQRMVDGHADIVKIAGYAHDAADNIPMLNLIRQCPKKTVAIAMGEYGLPSRVIGRKFGAAWTYAALERGAESAPGQLTVDELLDLYRYKSISPDTAVYGVIGNPIAHSASPAIMNAAFAHMGLNAVYCRIRVNDVKSFVETFRTIPLEGCSITIPHKSDIMGYLDSIDPLARRVGAVNTLVRKNDATLGGLNTDLEGSLSTLKDALAPRRLKGMRTIVLGAGGVARALVFGLIDRGARVTIANRTLSRATALAAEAGASVCSLTEVSSKPCDILINCTSVGMHPNENACPVSKNCLHREMVIFDTVYNPPETRLLAEAKAKGAKVISGLEMFLRQAEKQITHWTGQPAPMRVMEAALRRKLGLV